MATRSSIAIRVERAMNRIDESAGHLASAFSVEQPALPRRHRDADMLRAIQLEAIADWLQELADNAPVATTAKGKRRSGGKHE